VRYLVGTNKIIDYLKGEPQTVLFLQKARKDLYTSIISIGEMLEGLIDQPFEGQRRVELETFLSATTVIEVNRTIVEVFAKIRSDLRKKGRLIDNLDILIAATAVAEKLILIAADRDFAVIEGLEIQKID
jgi:tRNA(fMet)-specific endonuclease VapC